MSWQSVYNHYITFNSAGQYTVFFDTEWSRAPSPHSPIPDVRVLVHFAVTYPRRTANGLPSDWVPSVYPFAVPQLLLGEPRITWRIQHEELVHTELTNIDHHIQRQIKFKTLFFAKHSINYEQAESFETRLRFELPNDSQPAPGTDPQSELSEASSTSSSRVAAIISGLTNTGASTATASSTSSSSSTTTAPAAGSAATSSSLSLRSTSAGAVADFSSSSSSTGGSLSAIETNLRSIIKANHYKETDAFGRTKFRYFRQALSSTLQSLHATDLVLLPADYSQICLSVSSVKPPSSSATSSMTAAPSSSSSSSSSSSNLLAGLDSATGGMDASSEDEVEVDVNVCLTVAMELLAAIRATNEANKATTAQELLATQRAVFRLRSTPSIHAAMDAPLLALDPSETGKISPDVFIRFLGTLGLNLVDSEIKTVLSFAPKSTPDGFVLYQVFQARYESILRDALKEQDLDASRNDVGLYLLDLFRARKPLLQPSPIPGSSAVLETLSVEAVGYVLAHDASRVRLTPIQIYGILRAAGYLGDNSNSNSSNSNSSSNNNGSVANEGNNAIDIVRFSRLTSLVVYKLYEQAIAKSGIANPANSAMSTMESVASINNALAALNVNGTSASSSSTGSSSAGVGASSASSSQSLDSTSPALGGAMAKGMRAFENVMREKFFEFDVDDDGRLDSDEFSRLMADTSICLSQTQVQELRTIADTDKDGYVSYAEFIRFCHTTLIRLAAANAGKDLSVLTGAGGSSSSGSAQGQNSGIAAAVMGPNASSSSSTSSSAGARGIGRGGAKHMDANSSILV